MKSVNGVEDSIKEQGIFTGGVVLCDEQASLSFVVPFAFSRRI